MSTRDALCYYDALHEGSHATNVLARKLCSWGIYNCAQYWWPRSPSKAMKISNVRSGIEFTSSIRKPDSSLYGRAKTALVVTSNPSCAPSGSNHCQRSGKGCASQRTRPSKSQLPYKWPPVRSSRSSWIISIFIWPSCTKAPPAMWPPQSQRLPPVRPNGWTRNCGDLRRPWDAWRMPLK